MMSAEHAAHGDDEGHVVPFEVFRNVFVALLVLTVVTVIASSKAGFLDFGDFSLVVAMLVASTKAVLVALYFMHLKYENPAVWLYAIYPLLLLALLIGGIFTDNPTRYNPAEGTFIEQLDKPKAAEEAM